MVMRKVHSAALATLLTPRLASLTPSFVPVSTDEAHLFGTQKRLSFTAAYASGRAYLLFEPARTARDNYFTLDIAWVRARLSMDSPRWAELSIAEYRTVDADDASRYFAGEAYRHRFPCTDADYHDGMQGGAFEFSTASSRYGDALMEAAKRQQTQSDEAIYARFEAMTAEEQATTPEVARSELLSAVDCCMDLLQRRVLPTFAHADSSRTEPASDRPSMMSTE